MGAGRSGSTVLDTILNNHEDVFGVGELVHLFREGAESQENCSCGQPRDECPVWNAVRKRWCEWTDVHPITSHSRLLSKFTCVQRFGIREWLRLNAANRDPGFIECLRQTQAVYQSIAEVTGKSVIIESSKNPLRAKLLCLTPGLDVRLVHLVRDSRGVAWSRMKSLARSREGGVPQDIRPKPVPVSCGYWLFMNALSERVRNAFPARPSARIRYEDFVSAPDEVLGTIGDIAGLDYSAVARRLSEGEPMEPGHLYAGNRVRTGGPIRLRSDMAWQHRLTSNQQRLAWLLTRSQMRRYGYERYPEEATSPSDDSGDRKAA